MSIKQCLLEIYSTNHLLEEKKNLKFRISASNTKKLETEEQIKSKVKTKKRKETNSKVEINEMENRKSIEKNR